MRQLTWPSAPSFATGPDGQIVQSVKSIPGAPGTADPIKDVPNVGGFVTIDLTKLSVIPENVRRVLGGDF